MQSATAWMPLPVRSPLPAARWDGGRREQRQSSKAVAERVEQVNAAVEQLAGTQREVGESAGALKQLTADLDRMIARFQVA